MFDGYDLNSTFCRFRAYTTLYRLLAFFLCNTCCFIKVWENEYYWKFRSL